MPRQGPYYSVVCLKELPEFSRSPVRGAPGPAEKSSILAKVWANVVSARTTARRRGPEVAGQRQKAREELAFRRGGRTAVAEFDGAGAMVFSFPHGLLPWTREHVRGLLNAMGGYWRPSDMVVLRRYTVTVDRWRREYEKLAGEETIVNTPFGPKPNVRLKVIEQFERSMRADENTLGLSPLSRLRLGIKAVEGQSALERLKGRRSPRPLSEFVEGEWVSRDPPARLERER